MEVALRLGLTARTVSGLELQATTRERQGRAMQRRRVATRWALVALGGVFVLLGAFGLIRIALVWHLIQGLAR